MVLKILTTKNIFRLFSLLLIPGILPIIALLIFTANPHASISFHSSSHQKLLLFSILVIICIFFLNAFAFFKLGGTLRVIILGLLRIVFLAFFIGILGLALLMIEANVNKTVSFDTWILWDILIVEIMLIYINYCLYAKF